MAKGASGLSGLSNSNNGKKQGKRGGRKSSSENKNNVDILKSIKEGWQMGRQTGEKINETVYDERLKG